MFSEPDWGTEHNDGWARLGMAGMGALRVALLFGSAAIALALILTPIAANRTREVIARADASRGLDRMTTGTVGRHVRTYTVRRSILQATPDTPCIIGENETPGGICASPVKNY